ncbi:MULTISPECIES: hypothetical protein [Sorangium]|uniref:hypothetical protein n=1 Tax=Sorangium TaxID=39643 RepID=UPI00101A59BC|nr:MULTISPECIES: hypothetical protein [Sorangium]
MVPQNREKHIEVKETDTTSIKRFEQIESNRSAAAIGNRKAPVGGTQTNRVKTDEVERTRWIRRLRVGEAQDICSLTLGAQVPVPCRGTRSASRLKGMSLLGPRWHAGP